LSVRLDSETLSTATGSGTGRPARWIVPKSRHGLALLGGSLAGRIRSRHLLIADVLGLTLVALLALGLWLEGRDDPPPSVAFLWVVGIFVAMQLTVSIGLGLYRHSWRHASIQDMARIILVVSVGTVVAVIIVNSIVWLSAEFTEQWPASAGVPSAPFWLLAWALSLGVIAIPRFAIRYASELPTPADRSSMDAKRTLLYGAGWAGVMVARSAKRAPDGGIKPVGFLDDDQGLVGGRVAGLRVFGGLEALPGTVRRTRADTLLITMPNVTGDVVRRIAEAAMEHGLEVRTVPPVTDLLDGTLDVSRIRNLRVDDLLRRPPSKEHTPLVRDTFHDKVVAITGAAGSIGSELARQVLAMEPRRMLLIDQAESPLFNVGRELGDLLSDRRSHDLGAATEVTTHLANVAEASVMRSLFLSVKPDVVMHAAAYKHVPVLEEHPSVAVSVNIGGTRSVVDAAVEAGVGRLVLVSTDKAVWPSSVMGATKRVAEMIVADAGRRLDRPYISVRFGNVLASSGSVLTIFQDQLEQGRPLTITHPEMTRYFMTIPEAAWLILDAAAISDRPGLFVLDMGEPVRIVDIARDLVRLAGRDPESVPIHYVGLRKGEKLHETLFYDQETVQATDVPKVLRSEAPQPPPRVRDDVLTLMELADGTRELQLRSSLHAYVRWATAAPDYVKEDQPDHEVATRTTWTQTGDLTAIPVVGDDRGQVETMPGRRIEFAPRAAASGAAAVAGSAQASSTLV
jgi:FlaA1/EpsC-like NDP-sugar epimerase